MLWRDLGPAGFLSFQLFVGGNVLAALIHPLFLGAFAYFIVTGNSLLGFDDNHWLPLWYFIGVLVTGYVVTVIVGLLGLAKRRLLSSAWALVLAPVQWFLLSFAAWRALYQFWSDRYGWEKTEHGLAKSRRSDLIKRSAKPDEIVPRSHGTVGRRSAA